MVYVDTIRARGRVNNSSGEWCLMTADTAIELHQTAKEAGVDIRFYAPRRTEPYTIDGIGITIERDSYIISAGMRARLLALFGAFPTSQTERKTNHVSL